MNTMQICRDCGEQFPHDPDADRCDECVAESLCPGHPAGPFDPMGETVYCDGSCVPVVRDPESWQAVAREGRRFA